LNNLKRRLLLAFGVGLCLTIFGIMAPDRAGATENQEQVVVSPAQQAVNTALATATTEVQQAITATDTATATIVVAVVERAQAQSAVDTVTATVAVAQSNVALVDTATATINNINLAVTPIDQSSQVVQDAKNTITTAQTSINNIDTSTAQVQISEAVAAKTAATTAQATAQTELTQANIAIDNAQTAVNDLQATIGTSTNVLSNTDDAGVLMNLPFDLLMGGVLYDNVYVGSNATVTFGVNEGSNYWSTPTAPSISIAGWDWTTWSTGTGITYATTGTSLDIAWDLRPFPQQDASTQMAQIRFNADVNPNDGAWIASVTANGPIPDQARFNYRETTGGTVTAITDTNVGASFAGQISQGAAFTPVVDTSTATVQAAVDSANATIAQLNSSLTPVVAQNTTNTSNINAINTTSLTNTVNSAVSTKTNLQTQLNTNAQELITAISTNIPTPAPIITIPAVGTLMYVEVDMPQGYEGNTWFYQVITESATANNPYAGQTLNTNGAPASIELSGLTQGATYTVRVANWSGTVSQYAETVISIPAPQNYSLTTVSSPYTPVYNNEQVPIQVPPIVIPIEPLGPVGPQGPEIPVGPQGPEIPVGPQGPQGPAGSELLPEMGPINIPITPERVEAAIENITRDGNITRAEANTVINALNSDGRVTGEEVGALIESITNNDGPMTRAEERLISDVLTQDGRVTREEATALVETLSEGNGPLSRAEERLIVNVLMSDGVISREEATAVIEVLSNGPSPLSTSEERLIVEVLSQDGNISQAEVNNLSSTLAKEGGFSLAEKDLVADVLVSSAEGAPVTAANIESAGLEYSNLPPLIPVEVREDINGNPVVITAEVASALLVLENPAALAEAIAGCFNPDQAIEGLTEEQKCELGKALISIGADMSIPEREKAEDIVVVTVIAGQMIVGTASRRRRV